VGLLVMADTKWKIYDVLVNYITCN